MFLALVITVSYVFLMWLVFGKMKWLKFTPGWAIVSVFFGLHLLLIFMIGLRFLTPYSTDAKVVQHTIQLIPRLPEPTLVTAVLVEPNVPVKKGQPLFQFDRRPYEYKVNAVRAKLAAAEQKVRELKSQWVAASKGVAQARAQQAVLEAALAAATNTVADALAKKELAKTTVEITEAVQRDDTGAISKIRSSQARAGLAEAAAAVLVALANKEKARLSCEVEAKAAIQVALANEETARLRYQSEITIEGTNENTTVALLKAELAEALYYLDNTTMLAPADGRIVNLQVREGMVAGIVRIGAIASFIVDADRYVLATYNQEVLKWVEIGQPVEVALDLYPGQIFQGKVKSIWRASGEGQYLPSGDLPKFGPPPPSIPQGRYAVQIVLDDPDQSKFPIGAQGATAIYTEGGWIAALRKIGIRGYSWGNWLYPLPF